MLNFDETHTQVEENINEITGKKVFKKILLSGLIIANLFTFSGCSKNIQCDVNNEHAHYYINNNYLGRYIASEKSSISGLDRLDNYILIEKEDEELLNFANKKGLFRIDENKSAIENITKNHQDFVEYRYKYRYMHPMPKTRKIGKITTTTIDFIPRTGYSWTTNTEKNLTGETRICHYVYYGYKIEKNEKGKYEIIKSEPVDNLNDLPLEYQYIKENFYDIVNLYNKDEIFDYEDGPEEDKEIINENEFNDEQSISR